MITESAGDFMVLLIKALKRLKESIGINESDSFLDYFNSLEEPKQEGFRKVIEYCYGFDPDTFLRGVSKLEGNLSSSPSSGSDISPNFTGLEWDNLYIYTCLPSLNAHLSKGLPSNNAENLTSEVSDIASSGFNYGFLLTATKIAIFVGFTVLSVYATRSVLAQPDIINTVSASVPNVTVSSVVKPEVYSYTEQVIKILEHISSWF